MGKGKGKSKVDEKTSRIQVWIAIINGIVPVWVAVITCLGTITVSILGYVLTRDAISPTATPVVPATAELISTITTIPPSMMPTIPVLPTSVPVTSETPIHTPSPDPGLGMHIVLITTQTRGRNPLHVNFDARNSYFVAPDGTIFECGACTYTWRIREGGQEIYGPENTDGRLEYDFGRRGTYFVSVYVCRSGSDTDCAGSGTEIVVE
jgi:hypothetical protein